MRVEKLRGQNQKITIINDQKIEGKWNIEK